MKKKGLALLLAACMTISGAGSITSRASKVTSGPQETLEAVQQNPKVEIGDEIPEISEESTRAGEGEAETTESEGVKKKTVGKEEPEAEVTEVGETATEDDVVTEETTGGFRGEIEVDETAISVMDQEGNVTYVDMSGDDTIVEETETFRAATPQIVNFRYKSGVIDYTEPETGTDGYTAGSYGADAAYLGKNGNKVRFMLAGVIGEVPASNVQVISKTSAKSVSYYIISGGRLNHYISTNVNSSSYGSVLDNGPAPSYLKSGTKYYSYDGHYFYTDANFGNMLDDYNKGTRSHSVNPNNPYYNYFQFLPLRSQSNYSGSALNTMLNNRVTSSSKMRNTGNDFVNHQNKYGANALLMTGIGANESAWGTSSIAKSKNNIFGLNAVDSSPGQSANYFATVSQCIKEFAETWLSKQYLDPQDWKHFGAFLGNKASGMNVKYASDPYWGEKAAAMAWLLDRSNGNKDANKYTIGIKDTVKPNNVVNVRKDSATSSTTLYKTKKNANCAFIILNNTPVNGFYKIQSEGVLKSDRSAINSSSGVYDFKNMYAYISSDYLKIVGKGNGSQTEEPNPKVPNVPVPSTVKNVLTYSAHMAKTGWENTVKNGEQSGVTGLSRPMEAIKINVSGINNLGIKYRTHVSGTGWKPWVNGGELGGTTGESRAMEAIEIKLTGAMADQYDIHYRTHVQGIGWTNYVSNGETGGTTGQSKRIEAIQIVLLQKEKDIVVPSMLQNIIQYSTNTEQLGWTGTSANGKQSGVIGMSSALTGIKIKINGVENLGVKYSTFVPNVGWQSYATDGKESNAIVSPKRLEAIKIELTGGESSRYDIYYRVHAQKYGWLGWAKNGDPAGTEGCDYRLEAIQIVVARKGSAAPGNTSNAYVSSKINVNYATHIQKEGWQTTVKNGQISGTIGKSLRLEGIKINLSNQLSKGDIQYSTHIQNIGWQEWKKNNQFAGTEGLSKRLEAIKINLTEDMSSYYDVYYRVHAQTYGWLGWTKNGNPAGTEGQSKRLEAIEIKVVPKGTMAPDVSGSAFVK